MDDQSVKAMGLLMPLVLMDSPLLGRTVRHLIEAYGEDLVRQVYEILSEIKPTVMPASGPAPTWDEVSTAAKG